MKVSHVHLGVRDLAAAVQWLEKVWALKPTFRNEQMASVPFGTMTVIFDSVVKGPLTILCPTIVRRQPRPGTSSYFF
jgi:hypothetical protein